MVVHFPVTITGMTTATSGDALQGGMRLFVDGSLVQNLALALSEQAVANAWMAKAHQQLGPVVCQCGTWYWPWPGGIGCGSGPAAFSWQTGPPPSAVERDLPSGGSVVPTAGEHLQRERTLAAKEGGVEAQHNGGNRAAVAARPDAAPSALPSPAVDLLGEQARIPLGGQQRQVEGCGVGVLVSPPAVALRNRLAHPAPEEGEAA